MWDGAGSQCLSHRGGNRGLQRQVEARTAAPLWTFCLESPNSQLNSHNTHDHLSSEGYRSSPKITQPELGWDVGTFSSWKIPGVALVWES